MQARDPKSGTKGPPPGRPGFGVGPIARVVGTKETFIRQRPLPQPGAQGHYAVGRPGDPTGEVTNEDFAAALVVFANGVRGTFESSRSIVGPEQQRSVGVHDRVQNVVGAWAGHRQAVEQDFPWQRLAVPFC